VRLETWQIKGLTDKAYQNAKTILREKEHLLHALAKELIEKETLTVLLYFLLVSCS